MANFAFKSYVEGRPDRDDDIASSRSEARRIRAHMKNHGFDAHVEKSGYHKGEAEHRVWIQHPEHKDHFAYVTRDDAARAHEPSYEPYWNKK